MPRARHMEVQILGDQHGNLVHLYERDCSVQRRHQKVVEVAPAGESARERARGTVRRGGAAGAQGELRNAGTVEFLYDVDAQKCYFIEVNPRIQVEHTVTGDGHRHRPGAGRRFWSRRGTNCTMRRCRLPKQDEIPLYGSALQCRVTTEDPANNFAPDYGKISTYRSPAGFGIRLDGGTAYAGAVSPVLRFAAGEGDGLGQRLPEALPAHGSRPAGVSHSRRQDEYSIRRKCRKSSEDSAAGEVTTSFLDDSPELFRFRARGDRATKTADLSGRRDRERQSGSEREEGPGTRFEAPAVPAHDLPTDAPPGTRQLLQKLGPKKFAAVGTKRKAAADYGHDIPRRAPVADGHARSHHDLLATASAVARRLPNLFSLEMWGGATFDTALRFLHEDPWQRLRELRGARAEHLLSDAVARSERRRLRVLSGQCDR